MRGNTGISRPINNCTLRAMRTTPEITQTPGKIAINPKSSMTNPKDRWRKFAKSHPRVT
jgi:hypothetical protein